MKLSLPGPTPCAVSLAVVEIPRGSKVKYELDKQTGEHGALP